MEHSGELTTYVWMTRREAWYVLDLARAHSQSLTLAERCHEVVTRRTCEKESEIEKVNIFVEREETRALLTLSLVRSLHSPILYCS